VLATAEFANPGALVLTCISTGRTNLDGFGAR